MSEPLVDAHDHGNCNLCDALDRQLAAVVEALQDAADVLGCTSVNSLARQEFREGMLKALGTARALLADLPAAAQGIAAKLERAEKLAKVVEIEIARWERWASEEQRGLGWLVVIAAALHEEEK